MKQKRTYGGRRSLPAEFKKDVFVKIRLSQREKDILMQLHEKSTYKNLSTLIRDILLQKDIGVKILNNDRVEFENQIRTIDERTRKIFKSKGKYMVDNREKVEEMIINLEEINSKIQIAYLRLSEIIEVNEPSI